MELVLLAEVRVANFRTPGPVVDALQDGINEVSSFFFDNGDGIQSRILDAKTDESSRLVQLLNLHRQQSQELLEMRTPVDKHFNESDEDHLQPLLNALWLVQLTIQGLR